MIPALKKGEIDIIASGLSITPKRALEINYSAPYSSSGYSLVSNLALTKDFTSIKDLNSEKVYITAVKGTVSADLIKRVFPKAKIDLRKTEEDATSAVVNGTVHAFVSSSPIPEFISLKHSDKVDLPLKKPLLTTKEAFAINKGNQEMLNYLNAWITAHDADEWIDSSHEYWFNSLKWQRQAVK
jgi:polar amino acid transport system substrate-binding protein